MHDIDENRLPPLSSELKNILAVRIDSENEETAETEDVGEQRVAAESNVSSDEEENIYEEYIQNLVR